VKVSVRGLQGDKDFVGRREKGLRADKRRRALSYKGHAQCTICSNKMILIGPAAWGGYFFEDCQQGPRAHNGILRERYFYFTAAVKSRVGRSMLPSLQRNFMCRYP
jgi:hypothetical protein